MSGTAPRKHYNFDRNLAFCEDMTLAASDIVALAGTDVIYKIGPGRMNAVLVIDVQTIEIASTDEIYHFILEGSDSSTFASGIEVLADRQLGAGVAVARIGNADVNSVVGRYEIPFHNQVVNTIYDYVRLNVVISGTIATGILFTAWIAPASGP